VSQARPQMIAHPVEKNLRLVFQTAKGACVNDAVAISLKLSSPGRRRLRKQPSARLGAQLGVRGEKLPLSSFQFYLGAGH
jgi:hypothetical protein